MKGRFRGRKSLRAFLPGFVFRPGCRRLARHQLGQNDEFLRHRSPFERHANRGFRSARQSRQRRGRAGRAEYEPDVRPRRDDRFEIGWN